MSNQLSVQQVIDAIYAGKRVSYGREHGDDLPVVTLVNGLPYWENIQPLKSVDYIGLVIED